jgi:hypothetical protein
MVSLLGRGRGAWNAALELTTCPPMLRRKPQASKYYLVADRSIVHH